MCLFFQWPVLPTVAVIVHCWRMDGVQREVREMEAEEGSRWAVEAGGLVGGEEATPNREDKWMALTFPSSQRAGQLPWPLAFAAYISSPDSPLISLSFFLSSMCPSLSPSFSSSLFLIWFDWRRNVALLKVAAEEQWGIVLLHTGTHMQSHAHTHNKGM